MLPWTGRPWYYLGNDFLMVSGTGSAVFALRLVLWLRRRRYVETQPGTSRKYSLAVGAFGVAYLLLFGLLLYVLGFAAVNLHLPGKPEFAAAANTIFCFLLLPTCLVYFAPRTESRLLNLRKTPEPVQASYSPERLARTRVIVSR